MSKSVSLTLLLYLVLNSSALSQWVEKNNGLSGGEFTCLTEHESFMWAGTNGSGLFMSQNNGESWENIIIDISDGLIVTSILSRDSRLFVGIANEGVFITEDLGQTWIKSDNGLEPTYISHLTQNENMIYAAAFFDGMYRSSNSGESWENIGDGLNGVIKGVALIGDEIFAASTEGIFVSSNLNISWEQQNTGLEYTNIELVHSDGEYVYLSDFYDTYRFNAQLEEWQIINSAPGKLSSVDGVLYAGLKNQGIYKSVDNGDTWVALNIDILEKSFNSIYTYESNIFVGVAGSELLRSLNNGENWSSATNGVSNIDLNCFTQVGDSILVSGVGSGIYLSTDEGEFWTPFNENLITSFVYDLVSFNNDFYAATADGVFLYLREHNAWSRIATNNVDPYIIQRLEVQGEYLLGGTNGLGMYRSMGGQNAVWTEINQNLPGELIINDIVVNNDKAYISSSVGIFMSDDIGETWSKISTQLSLKLGLGNVDVNILMVNNDYLYGAIHVKGIGFTNDNGSSWVANDLEFGNLNIGSFLGTNNFILMSSFQRGVFISLDNGFSWEPANYGFPSDNYVVQGFFKSGQNIFAATKTNGVWKANTDLVITSLDSEADKPSFTIFPNPVTSILNLEFNNGDIVDCNVIVYNLSGELVESRRFINNKLKVDVSNYRSGIYFIKVERSEGEVIGRFLKE